MSSGTDGRSGGVDTSTSDAAAEDAVLVDRHESIGVVALNRPRAMNAVNGDLASGLSAALDDVEADPAVRVIVLTGTGRAFSAGMDLKAFAAGESVSAERHPEHGFAGFVRRRMTKPVVAAVNGFALGGGAELALCCDLIVMDETALIGLPEVQRGLFAGAGGLLRLPQQIPPRLALELALTGQPWTAQQALQAGLINRVVPAGTSVDAAIDLARTIAANAPLAVQATKKLLLDSLTRDSWSDDSWDANNTAMAEIFASADAQEGARAFAEKRPPEWSGR